MFVALTSDGQSVIAWETEKNKSVFTCPHCKDQVILKKGKVYVHHFAHKPGSECANAGESILHMKIKRSVFQSLRNFGDCTKCAMERALKSVRPDVSLRIRGKPVAVEIQVSSIEDSEINRRLLRYTDMGIFCLWIMHRDDIIIPPKSERNPYEQYDYGGYYDRTTKKWERNLHTLYGRRVYYWKHGAMVVPAHFDFGGRKRDAGFEFLPSLVRTRRVMRSDRAPDWQYGVGIDGKRTLHIARDFETGNAFIGGSGGLPVLIWKDRLPDWWHPDQY